MTDKTKREVVTIDGTNVTLELDDSPVWACA